MDKDIPAYLIPKYPDIGVAHEIYSDYEEILPLLDKIESILQNKDEENYFYYYNIDKPTKYTPSAKYLGIKKSEEVPSVSDIAKQKRVHVFVNQGYVYESYKYLDLSSIQEADYNRILPKFGLEKGREISHDVFQKLIVYRTEIEKQLDKQIDYIDGLDSKIIKLLKVFSVAHQEHEKLFREKSTYKKFNQSIRSIFYDNRETSQYYELDLEGIDFNVYTGISFNGDEIKEKNTDITKITSSNGPKKSIKERYLDYRHGSDYWTVAIQGFHYLNRYRPYEEIDNSGLLDIILNDIFIPSKIRKFIYYSLKNELLVRDVFLKTTKKILKQFYVLQSSIEDYLMDRNVKAYGETVFYKEREIIKHSDNKDWIKTEFYEARKISSTDEKAAELVKKKYDKIFPKNPISTTTIKSLAIYE